MFDPLNTSLTKYIPLQKNQSSGWETAKVVSRPRPQGEGEAGGRDRGSKDGHDDGDISGDDDVEEIGLTTASTIPPPQSRRQGQGQGLGQGDLDHPKESMQEPNLDDILKRKQDKQSHQRPSHNHDGHDVDRDDVDTDNQRSSNHNPRLDGERLSELFHHPRASIGSLGKRHLNIYSIES